jgi:nitrate/nitrite-specific signal transduction histidine kinase
MFKLGFGTLRARLLMSCVLIALLPVASAAVGSIAVGIYNGRKQTLERLESVAIAKELAINQWLDSLHQELAIVSTSDCAYERMWVVLDLAQEEKHYDFYNKAVRNRLRAFVGQSSLLDELLLVDARGRVALDTNPAGEGGDVARAGYYLQGLNGPYALLPFEDAPGPPQVTVTLPVVGGTGAVVGVLVGRASIDTLAALLGDTTGLGESGRAYVLSSGMKVLAGSALPGNTAPAFQAAKSGQARGSASYSGSGGRQVIGVYRWLPEVDAVLFVEQDQAEAMGAILTTLNINLVAALTGLLLAVVLSLAIMRAITRPLENLAETATSIAAGDLERHARIDRQDEIGQLARAFNSMTDQLRELIAGLERRVTDRTQELQRLALRLETSAQVSREVTSILAIDTLLAKVTELIESAFGYYAVHIYLVDQEANQLVFRASSASPPHDLVLDIASNSLNGEVVRTNKWFLANDVEREPLFRPDPHFPDCGSELVIPLRFGRRITGTLDMLSASRHAFRPEDVVVAQSLGDQIAIAIENARLYERSQELAVVEERNRLAREVHDAMNQSLYSIILFAGAAQKEAEKANQASIYRHLTRVESMAQQALKEMRLMVYELRPQELEEKGLMGALQQRLDAVEASAGLDVDLRVEGTFHLLPRVEEALYRIVQEALNNALKHASAGSVKITVAARDGRLEVGVSDDGVGFDPGAETAGLGLATMRERAEALGGCLEVQSARGQGTAVRLTVPLTSGQAVAGAHPAPAPAAGADG